ncbi:MAG: 3,4-dihydroxyphenylacetate 2,3-dioxygenase [Rhizobiales bacterium]|nr:3,4-dihydroxyphenylacetate 2,3-dioxygenase [Hyphomicrobiales bacterium]
MSIPKTVFRPQFAITRASHLVSVVADIQASRAFYVDTLGLIVSDEDRNTLYLRGIEEACHHSLVLKAGPAPVCERVGMRVLTEEDLDLAQRHFAAAGLPTQWADVPFQGRTLHTVDIVGTPLELCAQMATKPRRIMDFDLHHGACPQRLDHFQIFTPNVQGACEFYMAMGFRLSEYIVRDGSDELRMVFLQRKGNPHDIVFAHQSEQRLHHVAFTAPEAHHLLYIADLCGKNGYGRAVERGPGRHFGPGYARYVYLRDPDGHRIELFNNHYQTIDMEDEPVRWEASRLNRVGSWGPGPSASWLNEASAFAAARQPEATSDRAMREAHAG